MSFAWREGMHKEVKEKVVAVLTSEERVQFRPEHFRYLRYSQFYKICVNRFGSRSPEIEKGFANQSQYYKKASGHLEGVRRNISGFMFGFTKSPTQSAQSNYISIIPDPKPSLEGFKVSADNFIGQKVKSSLLELQDKYSEERMRKLKVQVEQLQSASPSSEQAFAEVHRKWEEMVTEVLNFNCLQQVLSEILTTYNNITNFKSELAQKTITIQASKVFQNLYQFGMKNQETEYNSTQGR